MRHTTSRVALVAAMTAGMATPALADVTVYADVYKDKDVTVTERLTVRKLIDVDIEVDRTISRAAEALALVNQTIQDNTVDRTIQETGVGGYNDGLLDRSADIRGSIGGGEAGGNEGVVGFNQDVGSMANQGNIWSVGLTEDPEEADNGAFTDAQAEVDQLSTGNTVALSDGNVAGSTNTKDGWIDFSARITGSIQGNTGIVGVNQNAGNMMNQVNSVAVAAGIHTAEDLGVGGVAVAMAEAALGQENTGNVVTESNNPDQGDDQGGTLTTAAISGSIIGNTGITQVNQAAGNNGNQGNVVAVGAALLVPTTE